MVLRPQGLQSGKNRQVYNPASALREKQCTGIVEAVRGARPDWQGCGDQQMPCGGGGDLRAEPRKTVVH